MIPYSDFLLILEHELDVHIPSIGGLIGDLDVYMPISSLQAPPKSV